MKSNFSDLREFLKEIEKVNFPFKYILLKDRIAKRKLFEEVLKTKKKPNLTSYINQYFTKKQLEEGFEEVHRNIPVSSSNDFLMAHLVSYTAFENRIHAITDEFSQKLVQNNLESRFYTYDLSSTSTYKNLESVWQELESLKKHVIEDFDISKYKEEAEILAYSIVRITDKFVETLRQSLLISIVDDRENIYIHIQSIFGDKTEKSLGRYKKIKRYFDHFIAPKISKLPTNFSSNPNDLNKMSNLAEQNNSLVCNKDLDFFFDLLKNHDGEYISETIEYFETGPRAGYIDALTFLNLWYKQWTFFEANWNKPYSVVQSLISLKITEEQKHILFGFILKFYGGYPIQRIQVKSAVSLRLLQEAFLAFPGDTPEKSYCRNTSFDNRIQINPIPKATSYKYDETEFKKFSANNDFDFYFEIANSELVFQTIEYFEVGPRRGTFEPLAFLNFFWEQDSFSRSNLAGKAHSTLQTLKSLPISDEQKHILFGFLLKWKGGYPLEGLWNADEATFYRLLEKEFLKYPGQTPEKEFCSKTYWNLSQQKTTLQNRFDISEKTVVEIKNENWDQYNKYKTVDNKLKMELGKYHFDKYHEEKNINSTSLFLLLSNNKLPYRIALLHKTGYLDFVKSQFANGITKNMYEILAKILSQPDRKVKGNILVLNSKSKENRDIYTSHLHIPKVHEDLMGL